MKNINKKLISLSVALACW